jgi:hypothetical protein
MNVPRHEVRREKERFRKGGTRIGTIKNYGGQVTNALFFHCYSVHLNAAKPIR